jgi:hypothetical protein
MKGSCISETCRVLSTTPAPELPQALAQLGVRQDNKERRGHWIEQEVLDLRNAIVHVEGNVDVCGDHGYVQKELGAEDAKPKIPFTLISHVRYRFQAPLRLITKS